MEEERGREGEKDKEERDGRDRGKEGERDVVKKKATKNNNTDSLSTVLLLSSETRRLRNEDLGPFYGMRT